MNEIFNDPKVDGITICHNPDGEFSCFVKYYDQRSFLVRFFAGAPIIEGQGETPEESIESAKRIIKQGRKNV